MGYRRAEWHSGLTYRQTCEQCNTTLEYTDEMLDFRPWYADGFVYCPVCKKPLRHDEKYAINAPKPKVEEPKIINAENKLLAKFCNTCGYKFGENDKFCSQCGAKR